MRSKCNFRVFVGSALLRTAPSLGARGGTDAPAHQAEAENQGAPALSGKKVIVADANSTHHLNLYVAYEKGLLPNGGWKLIFSRPAQAWPRWSAVKRTPFLTAPPGLSPQSPKARTLRLSAR